MEQITESKNLKKLKNISVVNEIQEFPNYSDRYLIRKRNCRRTHQGIKDISNQ